MTVFDNKESQRTYWLKYRDKNSKDKDDSSNNLWNNDVIYTAKWLD